MKQVVQTKGDGALRVIVQVDPRVGTGAFMG